MITRQQELRKTSLLIESLRKRNRELVIEIVRRSAEASEAREEVRRLLGIIQTHKDQTGHNLCFMNDINLWRKAFKDSSIEYPHDTIPPEEEFEPGCEVWCRPYYRSRHKCQGQLPVSAPPRMPGYEEEK